MTIRNLKEYIGFLTNGAEIPVIGSPNDPLLKELAGTVDNLSAYIGPLTKFATQTGTQVFYEFLQNADDAKATNAFFYFDEDNIVVINNGNPFYTDKPIQSNSLRKGQLKSFLSKQKGDKYGDNASIGRYGQGSKLLYDLLISDNQNEFSISSDKEQALIQAILHETKGPILFSWNNLSDLESLFVKNGNEAFHYGSCSNGELPLLTKIVYSFYPASLDEISNTSMRGNVELFTRAELSKCISFLSKIRYEIPLFSYLKGTLIYIPLGKRQAQQLHKALKGNLLSGISTSLGFLNNLKTVQVLDNEVGGVGFRQLKLPPVSSIGEEYQTIIGIPKNPKELDLCNFYQYFPITDTTYGLKFVIQSNAYEIGGDRQRIDLGIERNKQVLGRISSQIREYLQELRHQNKREDLIEMIKCIVSTDMNKSLKESFVEEHFYQELLEEVKTMLPVANGFADSPDEAKIKRTSLRISPSDISSEGWDWLDDSFGDYYDELNDCLEVEEFDVYHLLDNCNDRENLDKWMLSLSAEEFQLLLKEIENFRSPSFQSLKKLPLVRMSNGETYTLEEIDDDADLFFITSELAALEPILKKHNIVYGGLEIFHLVDIGKKIDESKKYNGQAYLKRFSDVLSKLTLAKEEKWCVLKTFSEIKSAEKLLRHEILLFENRAGEKRPLSSLLKTVTNLAPSGLLDSYDLKGSESHPGIDAWLMDKEAVWDEIIKNWDDERPPFEAFVFSQAVTDLQNLFNLSKSKEKIPSDLAWIWCDDEGWISIDELFYHEKLSQFSEGQYQLLCDTVKRLTDLKTVSFSHTAVLKVANFASLPNIGLDRISEHWTQIEQACTITMEELQLLKALAPKGFFNNFIIASGHDDNKYLIRKTTKGVKQYYSNDRLLNQFLSGDAEYHLLPERLYSYFQSDESLIKESEEFAQKLISVYRAEPAFIDMVIRHGDIVKRNFLGCLQRIDLYSVSGPDRYKEEFEGKAIGIILQHGWEDVYASKIFIDGHMLSHYNYEEDVRVKIDNGDANRRTIKFRLSILNSSFVGQSDVLSAIQTKLRGIRNSDSLFKLREYDNHQLEQDIIALPKLQNPDQLSFLIAFYHCEKGKPYFQPDKLRKRDFSSLTEIEVLNDFFVKNITFFKEYPLPHDWFDLSKYIDTVEKELLLPKEYLPEWLESWKNSSRTEEKTQFLRDAGLLMLENPICEFRRRVSEGDSLGFEVINKVASDKYFANNTLEWISQMLPSPIIFDSISSKAIHRLIATYVEHHSDLPNHILFFISEEGVIRTQVRAAIDLNNATYYVKKSSIESNTGEMKIWAKALSLDGKFFVDATKEYRDGFFQLLEAEGVSECMLEKEIKPTAEDGIKEWDEERYKLWKKEHENKYEIYVSPDEIPFDYYLVSKSNRISSLGHHHLGNVERHPENGINKLYLHCEEGENVLDLLAENQEELFKGDEAILVKLMRKFLTNKPFESLPVNSSTQVFPIADAENKGPISGIEEGGYKFNRNLEEQEYERLKDNLDEVMSLLETADAKLLKDIVEHLDLIKDALEKRDKKITPNHLVGLIGERLVYSVLKNTHSNANVQHVAYEVPAYDIDFINKGKSKKIDVKSTIHSIREEGGDTIPFFLKRSQYDFIRKNPDESYYIIRLSLKDLGLEGIYERHKDKIGNEFDKNELIVQLDDELSPHVKDQGFLALFRRSRLSVRMNIPRMEEDFLENED